MCDDYIVRHDNQIPRDNKGKEMIEYEPYTWPFWTGTVAGVFVVWNTLEEYGKILPNQPILTGILKGLAKNHSFSTGLFAFGLSSFIIGNIAHSFIWPGRKYYRKREDDDDDDD